MNPRIFARIVGAVLMLGAILALALPISIDDGAEQVACGDGFKGVSRDAGYRDAGHDIGDAMYPGFADEDREPLAEQCADSVSTRRAWGWPIAALGVIVLAGSFVQTASRPRPQAG